MGQHRATSSGEDVSGWFSRLGEKIKLRITRIWKALGGALAASSASILPRVQEIDWLHPQRELIGALLSAILGAMIVYFFPSNKD